MFGENSLEGSETFWCLDVANNTDNDHWWSLDDGHGLDCLLFVQFGAQLVHITDNMGHASFVADESGQMDWLGWIIFWESFAFTADSSRSLSGQETQRTASWVLEFSMTLEIN